MGNNRNPEDWHEWLDEWGDRFLLFARQQSSSFADAEDILQESFVRIWSNRGIFRNIEPGLIFTQIRRCAIDQARKRRRREKRERDYAEVMEAPLFQSKGRGRDEDLQKAMESLSPEQQEVLVLKVWGEQTFEAIGQTLDISPNTAASRYRYGLEKLRQNMTTGALS